MAHHPIFNHSLEKYFSLFFQKSCRNKIHSRVSSKMCQYLFHLVKLLWQKEWPKPRTWYSGACSGVLKKINFRKFVLVVPNCHSVFQDFILIMINVCTHLSLMFPLYMWGWNWGVLDHTSDVDSTSSIQVYLGFSQNSGHWDWKFRQKRRLL